MSQSLVNEGSGARTPLSGAIAAIIILLVILFLSSQLSALPQPVLAAVVLMAVAGLFQFQALSHLWHSSRPDFVVAVAALLGVLGSGLLRGVMIEPSSPSCSLCGGRPGPTSRSSDGFPGTRRFSDMDRHPDNEPTPVVASFAPRPA